MRHFNGSTGGSGSATGQVIISAICLVLNFLIGETIFANVILIMISFFTAVSAFISSLTGMFTAKRHNRPIGTLVSSLMIIGIICVLAMTDNIAVGWGP